MGSHGITATESDSYSASLSQDTGGLIPESRSDTTILPHGCTAVVLLNQIADIL